MTANETGIFLNELAALYPNVIRKDSNLKLMANMWNEALQDYGYEEIHNALQAYFRNDTKGYVPTAGQLIELIESKHTEPYLDDEHEFWGYE